MTDLWLIWSNEHRAWWGPGRHGYTTDTDRAGRYSEVEATEIVLNANRYRDLDLPPNELMMLAPLEAPDTSDIPEVDEEWFKKARRPTICSKERPWDGVSRPGTLILHPDASEVDGVRRCPTCGFTWEPRS